MGPLAERKDPGFAWRGDHYPKSKRGLAIDKDALHAHSAALRPLLDLAHTGFPAHSKLRHALDTLHNKYDICGSAEQEVFRCSSIAADRWRIMCKDVYLLAKSRCPDPITQDLASRIRLDGTTTCEPEAQSTDDDLKGFPSLEGIDDMDAIDMFPSLDGLDDDNNDGDVDDSADDADDTADIEIVAMRCKCPWCVARTGVIEVESDGDAEHVAVANPARGGQKRQTMCAAPAPARRLRAKTTPVASGLGSTSAIQAPVQIITRRGNKKRGPEAYMLDARSRYVASQSARACAHYIENMKQLKQAIIDGQIMTIPEARSWIKATTTARASRAAGVGSRSGRGCPLP